MRRAHVITASTRAHAGRYDDTTGPALDAWLARLGYQLLDRAVVPDGPEVGHALAAAIESGVDVILTTGGTGISPTDCTPEYTRPYLERELPGVAEAIRYAGMRNTPYAALSRGLAGLHGSCLIVNVPGSMGAVRDAMSVLEPLLEHVHDQRAGRDHEDTPPAPPGPRPDATNTHRHEH